MPHPPEPRTVKLGALGATVAIASGASAYALSRQRRRQQLPGRAVIVSPRKSTSIAHDGAVRSVQSAELTMPDEELQRLWTTTNLENLAKTYWEFLTKATLGLVRIHYTDTSRSIRLFGLRRLTLLRFEAPDYEFDAMYGKVTWRIRDGLLVARGGHGCGLLSLDVHRLEQPGADGEPSPGERQARIRIEVEVSNFYPSIAAGLSTPVYEVTQSFVHVLVTHGFLRSLATLELAESQVGRLAGPEDRPAPGEFAPANSPKAT
ncbi:MAG TPA: hypothetical protein VG223_08725 [Solirubrobacteraceae bacterium]|jgi:hypothetical protein|nr:hypothetical protein [Solirubrobacteraceae bacterium]